MSDQLLPVCWESVPISAENAKHTADSIRKKWKLTAVLTDAVYQKNCNCFLRDDVPIDLQGKIMLEPELRQNEISAVAFRVGCYLVRSSLSVYEEDPVCHFGPLHKSIYSFAKASDTERVKQELLYKNLVLTDADEFWMDNLCVFHEVSAKHISQQSEAVFRVICRAECGADEVVETICTAKSSHLAADDNASLFVQYRKNSKAQWIQFDGLNVHNKPQENLFELDSVVW